MRNAPYIMAGLSDSDMVWLLSMGRLRALRAGEALVEAGRPIAYLFFVTHGTFKVALSDGTRVATLAQGDVVGEMSFVEPRPPSASVRADEAAEVLEIPKRAILDRFEEEPVFAARFYRALAVFLSERLRDTTASIRGPAEQKAAQEAATSAGDRLQRMTKMFRKPT